MDRAHCAVVSLGRETLTMLRAKQGSDARWYRRFRIARVASKLRILSARRQPDPSRGPREPFASLGRHTVPVDREDGNIKACKALELGKAWPPHRFCAARHASNHGLRHLTCARPRCRERSDVSYDVDDPKSSIALTLVTSRLCQKGSRTYSITKHKMFRVDGCGCQAAPMHERRRLTEDMTGSRREIVSPVPAILLTSRRHDLWALVLSLIVRTPLPMPPGEAIDEAGQMSNPTNNRQHNLFLSSISR